jgi:hypothetical protein
VNATQWGVAVFNPSATSSVTIGTIAFYAVGATVNSNAARTDFMATGTSLGELREKAACSPDQTAAG